jgi:hypothetical protein
VLALLSLFTHIHAFWVAALLLALIDLPELHLPHFATSLQRMAGSLDTIAQSSAPPKPTSTGPTPHVVAKPAKEA